MKSTTIRQNDNDAADLELVARVDGMPIAKAIAAAIRSHIDTRRADPQFQIRLQQLLTSERDIARRLSESAEVDEDQ